MLEQEDREHNVNRFSAECAVSPTLYILPLWVFLFTIHHSWSS